MLPLPSMSSLTFHPLPPQVPDTHISFPHPNVLLVTVYRPKKLNALTASHHDALDALWVWYDSQPSLRCAVLTGRGRAFCAGQDLADWDSRYEQASATGASSEARQSRRKLVTSGFGGLSNRAGLKPIIVAVNGLCFGGGFEMVVNADLVLAAADAAFGLPEVTRGVVALAGALPRLTRIVGRQRASEIALLGRTKGYTAAKMHEWGIVNAVVPDDGKGEGDGLDNGCTPVAREAVRWAVEIAENSPDAVLVTREALRLGWEGIGPETATQVAERGLWRQIEDEENVREGLKSFLEKRKPKWVNSKL